MVDHYMPRVDIVYSYQVMEEIMNDRLLTNLQLIMTNHVVNNYTVCDHSHSINSCVQFMHGGCYNSMSDFISTFSEFNNLIMLSKFVVCCIINRLIT